MSATLRKESDLRCPLKRVRHKIEVLLLVDSPMQAGQDTIWVGSLHIFNSADTKASISLLAVRRTAGRAERRLLLASEALTNDCQTC